MALNRDRVAVNSARAALQSSVRAASCNCQVPGSTRNTIAGPEELNAGKHGGTALGEAMDDRRRPIFPSDPSGSGLAWYRRPLGRDVFCYEVGFSRDPTDEGCADIAIWSKRHRAVAPTYRIVLPSDKSLMPCRNPPPRHRSLRRLDQSAWGWPRQSSCVLIILGCHHGESDDRGGIVAGVAPWPLRCVPALSKHRDTTWPSRLRRAGVRNRHS